MVWKFRFRNLVPGNISYHGAFDPELRNAYKSHFGIINYKGKMLKCLCKQDYLNRKTPEKAQTKSF